MTLEELCDRLTNLEIGSSHQAQLLEELNEVVTDCNLRIDRLQNDNNRLREMMQNLSPAMEESPDE